jgi:hypothetical protein
MTTTTNTTIQGDTSTFGYGYTVTTTDADQLAAIRKIVTRETMLVAADDIHRGDTLDGFTVDEVAVGTKWVTIRGHLYGADKATNKRLPIGDSVTVWRSMLTPEAREAGKVAGILRRAENAADVLAAHKAAMLTDLDDDPARSVESYAGRIVEAQAMKVRWEAIVGSMNTHAEAGMPVLIGARRHAVSMLGELIRPRGHSSSQLHNAFDAVRFSGVQTVASELADILDLVATTARYDVVTDGDRIWF